MFEKCQAGDVATLFTLVHTTTMNDECEITLPHTPISPGCFDVGCAIAGSADGNGLLQGIDGVSSAAACQELCQQHPECFFFNFATEADGRGANCRLRPAGSAARIRTDLDGWPGVCGPKNCKDVVEET